MKIKSLILLASVTMLGCNNTSDAFEMKVEQVDELKGVILKGISMIGPIQNGCVANNDKLTISRDGKKVLETDARILAVPKTNDGQPFNGEAEKGEYVHLYIPDGKPEDVKPGDIVSSDATSCGHESTKS